MVGGSHGAHYILFRRVRAVFQSGNRLDGLIFGATRPKMASVNMCSDESRLTSSSQASISSTSDKGIFFSEIVFE